MNVETYADKNRAMRRYRGIYIPSVVPPSRTWSLSDFASPALTVRVLQAVR